MIKDVLLSVSGVGQYPSIGLLIFFAGFLGVLVWTFTKDTSYLDKMKHLPLENEPNQPNKGGFNG